MLYLLLIGLLALPFAGACFTLLLAHVPRVQAYSPLVYCGLTAITLVLAWIVRSAQFETVIGNWSPVSFTGSPLIVATNREGLAMLIAAAAVMLVPAWTYAGVGPHAENAPLKACLDALVFGALVMCALAINLVTLIVALGLVDLLGAVSALSSSRQPGRVLRDGFFHAASLVVLAIVLALDDASGNSLYLPLAHLPDRLLPFVMVALALRFSLVPLRAASDLHSDAGWSDKASIMASFLLVARFAQIQAPELRAWFFGLALFTACTTLLLGTLANTRHRLRSNLEAGALAVALMSVVGWQSGSIVVAAIAWLIGITLVGSIVETPSPLTVRLTQVARYVGAACLIGVPLTAGFIGRAGIVEIWAQRGLGGACLIVALFLAQILLTMCTLRLARWPAAPYHDETPRIYGYVTIAALLVLGAHALLFGIDPQLAGAPMLGTALGANGFVAWIIWLVPSALGAAAWWFEDRWLDATINARDRFAALIGLSWWQDILGGAINRLSRPLSGIFLFLESDGALLWAVIVILIVVLVSRPGAP